MAKGKTKSSSSSTRKKKVLRPRVGPFIFPGGPTPRQTTQGFPGGMIGGGNGIGPLGGK